MIASINRQAGFTPKPAAPKVPTVARRYNQRTASVVRQVTVKAATEAKQSIDWESTAAALQDKSPLEIMDHALSTFGSDIAIAFSGAEDVALIEYAHLTGKPYRVFSLDTGRLNPETYREFEAVEKHYGIHIEYTFPDTQEVLDLVRAKGMFSFYEDGHQECCRVRKVRPLRKQLGTLKAWITGQRQDQSPGTRQAVPVVQVDPVFEGVAGGPGSLIKYNPLSFMSSADTWNFLRVMNVPTNEMHLNGFTSIGCEPCTKQVLPNQHEREGRWWWEDGTRKECGLHSGNIKNADGEEEEVEGVASDVNKDERPFDRDLWIDDSKVVALDQQQVDSLVNGTRDKSTLLVVYAPWCPFCIGLEPAFEELAANLTAAGHTVAKLRGDTIRDYVKPTLGVKSFPTIIALPKANNSKVTFSSEMRTVPVMEAWAKSVL